MRSLDRDTAERLLDGQITPDDAPPGYGVVARVIAALRAPEGTEHRRRAPVVVGADRATRAVRSTGTVATRSRVPRRQLVAATVVLSGILTVGLASAGALPGPVQGIAASVLDRVGMHVPGSDDHEAPAGDVVTPAGATSGAASGTGTGTSAPASVATSGAASGAVPGAQAAPDPTGSIGSTGSRNPNAATPATPADPGAPGEGATPAVPATPAGPTTPPATNPDTPNRPDTPPGQAKRVPAG